jgi:hypothetical protein
VQQLAGVVLAEEIPMAAQSSVRARKVQAGLGADDIRNAMKTRVLFTVAGSPDALESKALTPARLRAALQDLAKVREQLSADVILNVLSLEEAFKLYQAASSPAPSTGGAS